MVSVQNIRIENYYSIGNINYNVVTGIFKLSGGNGQGKTSFCSALSQGLYNKSIKNQGTLIEDTYNKVTDKPYKITIELVSNGTNYTIQNDRAKNNIFIYREGIDITPKSIKAQLGMIESIIGVDYDTFTSLTYLSQSSMNSVFDLSDTNNILHKFFDVDLILFLEKNLKSEKRDVNKQLSFLKNQEDDIRRTISSLEKYELIDISPFLVEKQAKQALLSKELSSGTQSKINIIQDTLNTKKDSLSNSKEPIIELNTLLRELDKQILQLESGTCPLCGHDTTEKLEGFSKKREELLDDLNNAKSKFTELEREVSKLQDTLSSLKTEYNTKVDSLNREITNIENRIVVSEEKNKGYIAIKRDVEVYKSKLALLEKSISELQDISVFVEASLGVISSGAITKQYVQSFLVTFNNKMEDLCNKSDIPFDISVADNQGKIKYTIKDSKHNVITFENLSSGERTRVSLIVLMAIVSTLEVLTNVDINLIMFDELLSVLDKEGVKVFTDIISKYRETKSALVIQHHNEIDSEFFDSILRVKKVDNLTEILVER